ncbi:hypothetical protein ACRARG_19955 [Pseudooceanicola sp. C21-150M6]|uniref:hypothetical protein n=1 Tax=Pseudooceanicola sp. C21-150M6 TaxID=3434355 RepID=UPI003D7F398E
MAISRVDSENIFIATDNYFLEAYDFRNGSPLVVLFDASGDPPKNMDGFQPGWGTRFFRKRELSHIAIKYKASDWYRRPDLSEAFTNLRETGFLGRFDRIITYGGSMGGYAALAYAGELGADTVLALNPQSTLNEALAPWDDRYPDARSVSWEGPETDAANGCAQARQVYVVVDRLFAPDWLHVARLPEHNLKILNVPYVQHMMGLHLAGMGILGKLVTDIVQKNSLDMTAFHYSARKRRKLKKYYNVMRSLPRVKNSRVFSDIVDHHARLNLPDAK